MINGAPGLGNDLKFLCRGASLPSSSLGSVQIPHMGRMYQLPCDRTFEDWTITVLNDDKFNVRKAFEDWQKELNDPMENTGTGYSPATAVIEQLGLDGKKVYGYQLEEVWPGEVGAIEMSWDSNDVVEEFTVSLKYNKMSHNA